MVYVIYKTQSDWNHQVYWVCSLMHLIDDRTKSVFQIYGLLDLIELPCSWFVTTKTICIKRNHKSNYFFCFTWYTEHTYSNKSAKYKNKRIQSARSMFNASDGFKDSFLAFSFGRKKLLTKLRNESNIFIAASITGNIILIDTN